MSLSLFLSFAPYLEVLLRFLVVVAVVVGHTFMLDLLAIPMIVADSLNLLSTFGPLMSHTHTDTETYRDYLINMGGYYYYY